MLRIPKFYLSDCYPLWPNEVFPAFKQNGVEVDCFYASQFHYPCLAGTLPKYGISLNEARQYAQGFGGGFHVMTAWEWAAILWTYRKWWKTERGHTNGDNPLANGSGPFSHRFPTFWYGAHGMVGNLYEFVDGIRVEENKIYGTPANNWLNNNSADSADISIWSELATVNSQGFSNVPLNQTMIQGDLAKYLLLTASDENIPNGECFYQPRENETLVMERGGAFHSGREAGLACFRFVGNAMQARQDTGFRVACV